jgi:phosphoglycerate dehydrogenase-like enzyme
LAEADVVTLHTPLTPETDRLLDARRLALMKPGAFLINTARGRLIDQPALAAALAAGRLGGFAADVLDAEPPSADDALLASDRVVLTPHVASLTAATYRRMCVDTAVNVLAILSGASPAPNSVFRGS